ncbi:hypothetical protein FOMPIDRAFT_1049048 [Fomitopsis schrenkii]|uniref:Uncharacterized protein n=1 Tax=Fomitopsis schrenkii TaxID=2126942 RepID=S8E8R9_FOMSC|nr:hypothetical protein FOMPIDRAFT_1049048 [Fomitopsis schrenkii]
MRGRKLSMSRFAGPGPQPNLTSVYEVMSRRTLHYEQEIQDFESRLAINLGNSRAISTLLHEAKSVVEQHQHQTAAALETTRPHIEQTLAEDLAALEQLDVHLPRVEEELVCIGHVYDCGRVKAQELVTDLEWLDSPLTTRLRKILFTASAPVSTRVKALFRTLFALAFFLGVWIAWLTLEGAVRAHRQRLVWGERLLS